MASSSSSSQDNANDKNRRELVSHYSNPSLPSLVDHKYLSNGGGGSKKAVCDDMIYYCFDVLNSHLHKHPEHPAPKFANNEFPLFVTWYTGRDKRLRGCIGTFTPLSLHDGLKEYAITSAVRDSRFDPIGKDELAKLNCSVSLLTNFEPIKSWHDWEIGQHGIRIEFFNEKGHKRSATYLPEVALEQNWNHMEAIDSLLRKGGYKSPITPDFRNQLSVTRYQSDKLMKSFHDWQKRNTSPS